VGLALAAGGTTALTQPAAAAPAAPTAAAQPTADGVTVRLDPSDVGDTWEGWGTSLVWFANATGDYPDEIRNRLADLVFGDDGLALNIARYNIGGGNAPDVPGYLRPGGAVEGWWKAPEGTTRADKDWWDPQNPDHWNEDADRTQRWWVDKIKGDIDHWEAFSNSPPYFQTVSGYVSGGFDSNQDQLRADKIEDFAAYLVGAMQRLEQAQGIKVDTIDPFNESGTNYWGTRLNAAGNPVGGRQEGAHIGPEMQQVVLRALAKKLDAVDSAAVISAMDETNPGLFASHWNSYDQDVKDLVKQLNVHTYGTNQRTTVRDIAKAEQKPLWMSEVEGSWGDRQDFVSMTPGLGMAQRIVDDLRELEPTAWVFWQPVEDYDNMKPGGESANGANWGSIQMRFDCGATDTLKTCPIYTNTKFDTVRNFTHYIKPGDKLIGVDDPATVAAVTADGGATVVHVNDTTEPSAVTLDLSKFKTVAPGATVTPVTTDAAGKLVRGKAVRVSDRSATITVPAESVTTMLVDGVKGVAADAPIVQDGHAYRLVGNQSGRALTPEAAGATIRTSDPASADQLWRAQRLSREVSARSTYSFTTAKAPYRQLAVVDGAVALVSATDRPGPQAQWMLSTTGDGTHTLVNVGSKLLLEVGGQLTADGSPATAYLANSGRNQLWRISDETVRATVRTELFTTPGTVPTLPTTVVPVYRDGARGSLPVTWTIPPASRFDRVGTVSVRGVAVDPLGGRHWAYARVVVDTLVSTLPAQARTYTGGTPQLPATVTAVGSTGAQVERPVTWQTPAGGAFDAVGTVEVRGTVDAGDGRTLPATVVVTVTEPVQQNVATQDGVTVAATFTESGYSAGALRNGVLNDKGWSNWRPGTKNASDTITYTLPAERDVAGVTVRFFRDGSTDSYASSLVVQTRGADGTWTDAAPAVTVPGGAPAPVVTVPFAATGTTGVRVVLTARPQTHMTISEIEVQALSAAPAQP
jgi:hypothetical protein